MSSRPAHADRGSLVGDLKLWIVSLLGLRKGRYSPAHHDGSGHTGGIRRIVLDILVACVGVLILNTFIATSFSIPTESMVPELNVGDRIISARFGEPEVGSLIVFRGEVVDVGLDFLIKRVVAGPGDEVRISNGFLLVNGAPRDPSFTAQPLVPLRGTVWHPNCDGGSGLLDTCVLGETQYFVLGDNRTNSIDSRSYGPVDAAGVVGKGAFTFWPLGSLG